MEIFAPHSLEEAVELRFAHPDALPVAGGTDLMVEINARRIRPAALLDLSRIAQLQAWGRDDDHVFVGAGVTFARIARELTDFPPLVEAARSVASRQIRNRATIGGNLATASPAGDSLPVLAAYGADVIVASTSAWMRRIPLSEFLVGPKRTSLGPDELIVGVEWAPVDGPASFTKVGRRNAMIIAIASVCLQADPERHGVRIALGSVAPTVLRARNAEAFAEGLDWNDPATLAEFGRHAAAEARPIDDQRGTAEYRRHVVEVLARRALAQAEGERC
jgi:CO/xanthine dehydrogenase FAD-binding subunit